MKETPESQSGKEDGLTRRESMKFLTGIVAGFWAALQSGNTEEAAAIIEQATRVEQKEGPEVNFKVLFTYHETAEDIAGIPSLLAETDVLIPELRGRHGGHEKLFAEVAEGKKPIEEIVGEGWKYMPDTFDGAILKALYGTGKRVEFIDIPKEHPWNQEGIRVLDGLNIQVNPERDFSYHLSLFREGMKVYTDYQKKRETYKLARLKELVEELKRGSDKFSGFRNKNKVNILLVLGGEHTRIYHELHQSGESAEFLTHRGDVPQKRGYLEYEARTLDRPQHNRKSFIIGTLKSEVARRFMFGRKVDDELLARAFLQSKIANTLFTFVRPKSTHAAELFSRRVAERFTLPEISQMFEEAKRPGDTNVALLGQVITKINDGKEKIPRSEKELAELLDKLQ